MQLTFCLARPLNGINSLLWNETHFYVSLRHIGKMFVSKIIVHIFLPLSICRVYQKGLTLYFVTIFNYKIFCKVGYCIEFLPSKIIMYDVTSP
jgi:hypothetical protein